MHRTGIHEVYAAAWHILADCQSPSTETSELLRYTNTKNERDSTTPEPWLRQVAELFFNRVDRLVVINRHTHPQLADHVVKDAPVIPVAYVIEWLTRVAQPQLGSDQTVELSDVKVLKGVVADGFDNDISLELRIVISNEKNQSIRLEIVDQSGRRRYNCFAARLAPDDRSRTELSGPATELPEIYNNDGVLFHGLAFQVLQDVRLPVSYTHLTLPTIYSV